MNKREWIILDTNVWIFGLRNQPKYPACSKLLLNLPELHINIPRQIIQELQANLTVHELHELFELVNKYSENFVLTWEKVNPKIINKYVKLGFKYGDAAIAAHLEELKIRILISENRDFMSGIKGLPFQVVNSEEAIKELKL